MKQGYVNISGVELIKKTYARKLEPAISREEYAAIMLMERGITRSSLGEIALAMTGSDKNGRKDKEEDEQLIKELEGIIAKLRGQKIGRVDRYMRNAVHFSEIQEVRQDLREGRGGICHYL